LCRRRQLYGSYSMWGSGHFYLLLLYSRGSFLFTPIERIWVLDPDGNTSCTDPYVE
jgi:hypothetical protein